MALGTSWTQIASQGFTYLGYSGTAYVYAKLNSQDVANNRSKIDLQLRIYHSVWVQSYDTDFYLSGYGWLGYAYRSFDSGTTTIMSSQITVNHNADGTGSFTATGGYEYKGIGVSATTFTSSSQSLPTIPRASVPSASPNPITIGNGTNTLTVNTNRKSSSFTHTVRIQVGSWSAQNTSVGASTTFSIPYAVIAQFSATSKTATGTITCTTYSGSTNIGQKTASFTLQVNAGVDHPNVGTVTVTDTNPRTSAILNAGQFAYGISTLEATIPLTVSGSYTELASATVTCGTKTQTYSLSGTSATLTFLFDKINAASLSVTVKDKRGTQATGSKSWTLLQYAPLTATAEVGRPSATGSTAVGQVSGTAYAGNYGNTPNSLTIVVDFKEHSDQTYSDAETYTHALTGTGATNWTEAITFIKNDFDYQKEYDVRFTVSDLFSTAVYICRLTQGLPIISWDENEVDVFGDLHIHDRDNPYNYQDVMQGFDGVLAHGGEKNLCPQIVTTTVTVQGVTFTPNADGTLKTTGTSTGPAQVYDETKKHLPVGTYKFNGCPSGGSTSTYFFRVLIYDSGGTLVTYESDTGNGAVFEITNASYYIRPFVSVNQGTAAPSGTWKPMIYDARLASVEYVPCYVVSANNSWAIRKYPDGTFDAWMYKHAITMGTGAALAGGYYHKVTGVALPQGIASVDYVTMTISTAQLYAVMACYVENNAVTGYIWNAASGAGANVNASFFLKGRWR